MKLKDWDDAEEKVVKPERDRGRKEEQDLGDVDSGELDFEEPGKEAGPGLRRRSGGLGEDRIQKGGKQADREQQDREREELAPLPGWAKALIFTGLAALAAVICAVLWHFVHPDKPEERNQGILAEANGSSGDGRESDSDLAGKSESESDTASEPVPVPTTEPTMEPTAEPVASPEPERSPEPEEEPEGGSGTQVPEPSESSQPQPPSTAQPESADQPGEGAQESGTGDMRMTFTDVQESVTPKEAVNLRTMPTTTDDRNIVTKIRNGEALVRTGINTDTGWSRIDYNGQILYAVSQYLTTDLDYITPVRPTDPNWVTTAGGSVIIFENCDDWITPKEYVNLRTEPSTVQEDATVSCQLNYGEKAHRTGYSEDFGWSRVEYNGQVLYVVTSFVYVVPTE